MKKIVLLAMAVLMAVGVLAGCGETDAGVSAEPTKVASQTAEAATQEPQSKDAPKDASPTTGLPGHPEYKPVIVQIENEKAARPQAGLQEADVVYETLIEATDTRFTCLFNDTYAKEAGPLRSARYYHQLIQQEWDALFVHMGGANNPKFPKTNIYGESGEHIKQRLDGTRSDPPKSILWARKGTGKAVEHTRYVNVAEIAKTYEYEPTQRQSFQFYPLEDYSDNADAKDIKNVELSFWSGNKPDHVEYKYDAKKDKLIRYMDGEEFIAEETDEAIEVQNVIIQYTSVKEAPNEEERKYVDMIGEGKAEFFVHGKHLKGTWERKSEEDPTIFYLENGDEVTLAPGNTWIEVHPDNKQVLVNYADGTDYVVNEHKKQD